MTNKEAVNLLIESGFDSGWVLSDNTLVLWEHDTDPPAPLTRPEASDETPSAD